MTNLVIINNGSGKMQVGKDGLFYILDSTGLAENIHAVQWNGSEGEIEYKDTEKDLATHNESIDSITNFQFAVDAWDAAKAEEEAAIALANAKSNAFNLAYDQAIANGDSEEDASTAGKSAADAVTSV